MKLYKHRSEECDMKYVFCCSLVLIMAQAVTPTFAESNVVQCDATNVIISDNNFLDVTISERFASEVNTVVWVTTLKNGNITIYCADGKMAIGFSGINPVEIEITLQTGAQVKKRSE